MIYILFLIDGFLYLCALIVGFCVAVWLYFYAGKGEEPAIKNHPKHNKYPEGLVWDFQHYKRSGVTRRTIVLYEKETPQ